LDAYRPRRPARVAGPELFLNRGEIRHVPRILSSPAWSPLMAKTILIVEDNAVTREGLAVLLSRAGYATLTAKDGREALDTLARGAPDLMLLDMLLPVVDGWRILERRDTSVPVIVVTGTILSPEWAAEHGAAGFLKKPVEEAELLAEVRRVLGA